MIPERASGPPCEGVPWPDSLWQHQWFAERMEEAGAALMGRGPTWRPARLPRVCSVTLSPLLPLCLAPSVVLGWLAACETGRDTRSFVELLLDDITALSACPRLSHFIFTITV